MIKKDSKVLITGCGGMLGEGVYQVFKDACNVLATDIDLNAPWLEKLDVSSKNEVDAYLSKFKPDYIVHLAALTDMEYCELHPEESYATNANGVKNMSDYVSKNNTPFLYISTAGIFDGKKDEYDEKDAPNPLSIYAKSKYEGELTAKSFPKSIVIRAGWMMGGGPEKDKKFINKIIKQLKEGKKELSVVSDKHGTPCYTYDLARSIYYLLDTENYGLYHGVCDGGGTRYDVAEHLLKVLGLDGEITLTEVNSDYFKKDYFAPRPYSEKLLNKELKRLNPSLTRDWRVCLEEYVNKFDWDLKNSPNQILVNEKYPELA